MKPSAAVRHQWAFLSLGIALVAALAGLGGCDWAGGNGSPRGPSKQAGAQGGLFDSVADSLDRMEQFETSQILKQICDRLNQWSLQDKPQHDWRPDPLVADLPDDLRNLMAVKLLDSTQYRMPDDAWFLQESLWLRNISRRVRADQFEDLAVAERLFDWTVRNIQLEPDTPSKAIRHQPFETLLFGRGQAVQRAWLFILLARQQGLDVVMLAVADKDGNSSRLWLPALLSGGELYLFDCRLGLPIPGPEGRGVATLAGVVSDPTLLHKLDLDSDHPYPVQAEDLASVAAFVEASPHELSRRMALVESRLSGKKKMALTSPGSALVDRVSKVSHVARAQLWTLPFDVALWRSRLDEAGLKAANREMFVFQVLPTLLTGRANEPLVDRRGQPVFQPQPTLLTARTLDFKGEYDGENGAKSYYLKARPPDAAIENFKLPDELVKNISKEDISRIEAAQVLIMRRAKQNASYWLGLVHFSQQNYPEAIDFFAKRTLEASPKGPWSDGARYNLARSYEATGEIDKAVALYESDTSTQAHGNKLRARWLKERGSAAQSASAR